MSTPATNDENYGLWLLATDTGTVELTGWTETTPSTAPETTPPKTEYWPGYPICEDRQQLPARLEELSLQLSAGSLLSDLDNDWHVHVRHPDRAALRAQLDSERAARTG